MIMDLQRVVGTAVLLAGSALQSAVLADTTTVPAEETGTAVPAVAESSLWDSPAVQPISYDWQPCAPVKGGMSCGSSCTCGQCGCQSTKLFGLIAPSDMCFSDFVSPISNALFFEDPRTLSEIRPIFANHWIPDSNPAFQGGNAQFLAAQIRIALTDRLSIIATKDGYIWLDSNNEAAIPDEDGFADVAAGLKYNLIRDPHAQFLVSSGFTFEADVGTHDVFQGRGDGEFHLFTTMGKGLSPHMHWLSATGFRLPTDTAARSQMWYWSNHVDYEFRDNWYALLECNWFHWMKSGNALPVNFEGGDLFNLGSTDVAGNDIVTLALGGKKKFGKYNELGAGYEFPVTNRKDILQSRLYVDLIIRY
ncbi:hypothetical protein GC163_07710 [bacterium]|nr:hypothetical protein [bacterium]